MSIPFPTVSVVIPTYNRKDHLREAIRSSLRQTVPVEIIVLDDGSTDGTEQMMREEFPAIRYQRFAGPNGPALLRTLGSDMASGEILFPIDDDARFPSCHTIQQTLEDFQHPRIGAVGIPFINVCSDGKLQQVAPDRHRVYVTSTFSGCATPCGETCSGRWAATVPTCSTWARRATCASACWTGVT